MSDATWIGKACALGVLGLGATGLLSSLFEKKGTVPLKEQQARQRVRKTFLALGAGIGITAGVAKLAFDAGLARWLLTGGRWTTALVTLGGSAATMVLTFAVPSDKPLLKFGAYTAFNATVGLSLSPWLYVGGPMLMQAATYTGALSASLCFAGVTAPSRQFFFLSGPLTMAMCAVSLASLASSLMPAARLTHNFSLYGGLATFAGYLLYDANVLMERARLHRHFDPFEESVGVYLDTVNVFVRVLVVLVDSEARKKRQQQQGQSD